ncbi:MAG: outer membrane beta-barrel protein [Flavobacterium sp.]|nr:outer membrane beta-barrel protein [Flavobacterium sp.]
MTKLFSCFLVLFFVSAATSQNVTISGKIIEKTTKLPVEAATVYISSAADSTLIAYSITDRNGAFTLPVRATDKPIIFQVSFIGFKNLTKRENQLASDIKYGVLELEEDENLLNEVVVIGEAPPIRIKKDTLEFNAASFKVRPDANVETMLKQLPGVEIDTDGKITVNGKEVNNILVNGKPFFDANGKIALQSLPADIINKVQITDTKTKKEELAGQQASSNNASINLTIDDNKNKGFFGKITGGYGTDDRYESSLLINYFKDKRKLSVLASSNNINATGFSMNEIFDSMGGGRNQSVYYNDNGSFGINNMRFGGGNGITQSQMVGLNYADELFKGFDTRTSYFYSGAESKNTNRTKQVNLLPDGTFTTESTAVSNQQRDSHSANLDIEFKIDSTSTIFIAPRFTYGNSISRQNSSEFSSDENGLLNDNITDMVQEQKSGRFNNSLVYTKKFAKKNRMLSVTLNNDNSTDDNDERNISTTRFYEDADSDGIPEQTSQDVRNQLGRNTNVRNEFSGEIEWEEPVTDSLRLVVAANYSSEGNSFDRNTADFNPVDGEYNIINEPLSRFLESGINTFTPEIGFRWQRSKMNLTTSFGTAITRFDNESRYLGDRVLLTKDYMLPAASATLNYNISTAMSIWANYSYDVSFPSAAQVLPVEDFFSPLNTTIGNPNLNPNKYHSAYVSFRNYDFATRSGYSLYAGGNFYDDQINSTVLFDESRKRTTTYENVSGTYNSWFGVFINKSIKREAHSYRFSVGLNGGVNFNKGFTNGELFEATSLRFTPRVSFNYDYGELVSINPTYNFTLSETSYENYVVERASNLMHRFNLQTTTYWPKGVVFGNDFGYTYNSNIADGFKKDFYLWNVSLGYNFFKDKLLAKVKVYDVLNQNQSATRTISATTIRDEENVVLQQYVMFSLTYKLSKFGGAEKKDRHRMF